jgi:hypothetical protein
MFGSHSRRQEAGRTKARLRPRLEWLEARLAPATFVVNTTLDTVATNFQNGKDATGHISLRSAIMAADSKGGTNSITLPAGTFKLTIAGADEDKSATGDLDISDNLTIKGNGSANTIIDGNNLDRVIEVLSGNVTISNLTIQHGRTGDRGGGGILHAAGTLTLSSVVIANNVSQGANPTQVPAGAAGQAGGFGGDGDEGGGGGIFNDGGSLIITNSTIVSNQAIGGNGGAGGNGGFMAGASGFNGRTGQAGVGGSGGSGGSGADGVGGGILNANNASIIISGTTFSLNKAIGGAGGAGGGGAIGIGGQGGNALGSSVGPGGSGFGGSGGAGGGGGDGEGGGLFNLEGSVSFTGTPSTISSNQAIGGAGGAGGTGGNGVGGLGGAGSSVRGPRLSGPHPGGGTGGQGEGGAGGAGGSAGDGQGGGISSGGVVSGSSAFIISSTTVTFSSNLAAGNVGGSGGAGGFATGGQGGNGANIVGGTGGDGGASFGGKGGAAGIGGEGNGGGLYNDVDSTVSFTAQNKSKPPAATTFTNNQADGGGGGAGRAGGSSTAGNGGKGGALGAGGAGAQGVGGNGGKAGAAGNGSGGGLFNIGTATFTGITVNFTANQATSGFATNGGGGGSAKAGNGGNGTKGGDGGNVFSGIGGEGGVGGIGQGGGIFDGPGGHLALMPRLNTQPGTAQANATDLITANQAFQESGGNGGLGGNAVVGFGGAGNPNGAFGHLSAGHNGANHVATSLGVGGGINIVGSATIDNTTITGNHASTSDNDVHGTFIT